jgi:hypothetical protein
VKPILILLLTLSALGAHADESWRKVAFVGDAKVKKISGLVEVIAPAQRILHPGEEAKAGETLRIWKGAELVLQMNRSQSLVRAAGPVLLRLAPEKEGFNRASVTGAEDKEGYVVRAVHGHGRFLDGERWRDLQTGMVLPEGTKVRPYHDSILDFYNATTRTVVRVTDHSRQTTLPTWSANAEGGPILAAKMP